MTKKIISFLSVLSLILCFCVPDASSASNTSDSVNWTWARSAGANEVDSPWKVAVDSSGNVYTIGWFGNTLSFGSYTLTAIGQWSVYVCKYDPKGNVLWAKSYAGNLAEGIGLTIDKKNNFYMTGYYEGTSSFGSYTVTSTGDRDIFVAKCDSNGNVLWVASDGGAGVDFGQCITLDASGYLYVTGLFSGSVTFGNTTLTSQGAQDCFVVKYDTSGNMIWVNRMGGNADGSPSWPTGDRGMAITADKVGNTYVTGQFNGTSDFGNITLTSTGAQDVFIAKLDPSGNVLWAVRGGGGGSDVGQAVALDGSETSLYCTGQFASSSATFGNAPLTGKGNNDAYLMKLDTSGNILWLHDVGGPGDDYGLGVAVDESGNCYMTGAYSANATFGALQETNAGGLDVFTARYDSSGALDTVIIAGGTQQDLSHDITADRKGSIYITGFYQGTVPFGSDVLVSNGNENTFTAKLKISRKRNAIVATTIAGFPTLTCDSVTFSDAKIWNTGTDTLHISNITITQNNEGFSIASPLTYPITVPPGSDTVISIRFAPATTGPKTATLNVLSDASNTQTLSTQLSGERDIPTTITASISIAAYSGSPGDTVRIPVIIRSSQQALLSGMSYTARVSYDGTVLLPVRIINGTIDSIKNGYVVFTANNAADTVVLICIVGLGDSVNTTIHVDTIEWEGCTVQSTSLDGTFQLQGLCTQGSTRLFTANGSLTLAQNVPNPFTGETMIRYSTIEDGETELYVTDVLGRRVETLSAGYRKAGQYTAKFNGDGLRSGIYYYALRTPTQILRKTMVVEK